VLRKGKKAALDISAGGDEQVLGVCDGNRAWIESAGEEYAGGTWDE
jgi:hypothetical protein